MHWQWGLGLGLGVRYELLTQSQEECVVCDDHFYTQATMSGPYAQLATMSGPYASCHCWLVDLRGLGLGVARHFTLPLWEKCYGDFGQVFVAHVWMLTPRSDWSRQRWHHQFQGGQARKYTLTPNPNVQTPLHHILGVKPTLRISNFMIRLMLKNSSNAFPWRLGGISVSRPDTLLKHSCQCICADR